MNSKKGLSEIVTSILIILIAVAAVVVIWQVLLPLIKQPGDQGAQLADCTANPITLADAVCGGTSITVTATKMGAKAASLVNLSRSDVNDNTATVAWSGRNNVAGSIVFPFTGAVGHNYSISGYYRLAGATNDCNIASVEQVSC